MNAVKKALTFLAAAAAIVPFFVSAAPFKYAGWIPFWKQQSGAHDLSASLGQLAEISPFSYEVNPGGTLRDSLKITEGFWPSWLSAVHDAGVKIIPTVAWFDGGGIQRLLSSKKRRIAHENTIVKLVKERGFDGIDIDYEGKMAETRPYFSLFIGGLSARLHKIKKTLSCTVEARTPPPSLYVEIPNPLKYANNYAVLDEYCDEVRVMAYDQGTIDLKLDAAKGNGALYAPVADAAWDEKVIKETLKTISRKKVMLGIPTYGYEYEATWANGATTYRRLRSLNYFTAIELANSVGAVALPNNAGELGFWYATSTLIEVQPVLRTDVSSTLPAEIASSTAAGGITRFVSLSDARAVAAKISLAKKYGLRGAAFFKFDGGFDPLIWQKIKN